MDQALDSSNSDCLDWSQFVYFDSNEIFELGVNTFDQTALDPTEDVVLQSDVVVSPSTEDLWHSSSVMSIPGLELLSEMPSSSRAPEQLPGSRLRDRQLLPALNPVLHNDNGSVDTSSDLSSRFEQAICAVQNDRKRKFSPLDDCNSGFSTFRVDLVAMKENPTQARKKIKRLKRSVARPCLLCQVLKLKVDVSQFCYTAKLFQCSPGRPCARCMEKHMGQEDLSFTRCLRDNPSKFNPFKLVLRYQGSLMDDVDLQCMTAYRMGYLTNSPLLFIWTISYLCYFRTTDQFSGRTSSSDSSAVSLCGSYKQQISHVAFQELERALTSRDANQVANNRGRLLTIALSLYAWLGNDNAKRPSETLSEMERNCKLYLSEYIDLLVPYCIPGVPGATIRNLMWTMHNLMVFPAIPQLNFGSEAIHKVYSDAQRAVSRIREMILRSMSNAPLPVRDIDNLRQEYTKNYWPRWNHQQDDPQISMLRLWPLLSCTNKVMTLWFLRLKKSESPDPILKAVAHINPGGFYPSSKSFLEWIEDTRKMLLRD